METLYFTGIWLLLLTMECSLLIFTGLLEKLHLQVRNLFFIHLDKLRNNFKIEFLLDLKIVKFCWYTKLF